MTAGTGRLSTFHAWHAPADRSAASVAAYVKLRFTANIMYPLAVLGGATTEDGAGLGAKPHFHADDSPRPRVTRFGGPRPELR